jgi:hypothetical protein
MSRLVVVFVLLVSAGLASAADARQLTPQQERRLAQATELTPGEIQRLFDAYAIVQAQEMLSLNDTQYGQFVVRLKTLQEVRRRGQQARQQMLQELLRMSNAQPGTIDEGRIRDRLKALEDHDTRNAGELRRAYAAIDEVLDIRQRGRFRVFEDQMERRKFELLLRARQSARAAARRPRMDRQP